MKTMGTTMKVSIKFSCSMLTGSSVACCLFSDSCFNKASAAVVSAFETKN